MRITLINGAATVFSTSGKGKILNNIIGIYGSDTGRNLLPVESKRDGFLLKGFVSTPAFSVPSRNRQIFCVNGRVVSSKVMERALEGAYREKLFQGRFPIAFLFLSMPAEKLDVNIHPTKKEVRFDDDFEVEDFINKAVRKALSGKDAIPKLREENILTQKTQQHRIAEENIPLKEYGFGTSVPPAVKTKDRADESEQVDIKNILTTLRRNKEAEAKEKLQQQATEQICTEKPASTASFDFDALSYLGVLFRTYIIAADQDSFYLIDQHAAHERIFYEKLLDQYHRSEKQKQQLLMPLRFQVAATVTAAGEEWIDQLDQMGYDVEDFGSHTYIVREIPAFMEIGEAESFLSDFFQALEDNPDFTNQKTLEKIIMRSCKSAVKGGDHLGDEEILALMEELKRCINPFSCPHGRPTFIRMTKYEIEKMFKRV